MKYFRTISTGIISAIMLIFFCNVYCLELLYRSIRADVHREVMNAMADTDIDEMWERVRRAGLLAREQGGDVTETTAADTTDTTGYRGVSGKMDEEGNFVTERHDHGGEVEHDKTLMLRDRSYTNQIQKAMSRQMHMGMDALLDFNLALTDSILMARLADRGIHPSFLAVEIVDSTGAVLHGNVHVPWNKLGYDVFTLCFNPERGMYYRAYMTPITRHIMAEMRGVVVTVLLLMLAFVMAFVYLFRTVSHLRTLEEMKDDFTNNMTHELKTPIAIAYSANDALLHFDTANDPEKRETYLRIANRQLKRLGELVEGILAVSMERRKTMRLSMERILLLPLVQDVAAVQGTRMEKDITIDVRARHEGIAVEADRVHLTNVLNNLIDNAIKYSGTSVRIGIVIGTEALTVTDNGMGIPAKSLPLVFNRFYRVPHGDCQDVRGYGIGLYYVREILTRMGMSIDVSSRPCAGTTFTIRYNGHA